MKRILRIVGIIIVILIILLVVLAGVVFAQSNTKLNQTWDIEVAQLQLPEEISADMLAEGERLFHARGCGDCHTANGGGRIFIDDPAMGLLSAPNLTPGDGGIGQVYTIEDFIRSIQHGVRPDGTSLVVMPSPEFQQMREEELVALLAYLQSLEPVDNVLPERQPGPLFRVLLTVGAMETTAEQIDHETAGLIEVEAGANVEFGEYLAVICAGCHGTNFAGGIDPGAPGGLLSANITFHEDGIGNWSLEDFMTALRTGIRPDGTEIDPEMPWAVIANWTDEEIEAVYLYLQTVEPLPDSE